MSINYSDYAPYSVLTIGGAVDAPVYVTLDELTFGDSGGGGATALANINAICDMTSPEEIYSLPLSKISAQDNSGEALNISPYWEDDVAAITSRKPQIILGFGHAASLVVYARYDEDCSLTAPLDGPVTAAVNSLTSYPVLSESHLAKVEDEWMTLAWMYYAKTELLSLFGRDMDDMLEGADNDALLNIFKKAVRTLEHDGAYSPQWCNSYVYVNTRTVFPTFARLLLSYFYGKA